MEGKQALPDAAISGWRVNRPFLNAAIGGWRVNRPFLNAAISG